MKNGQIDDFNMHEKLVVGHLFDTEIIKKNITEKK